MHYFILFTFVVPIINIVDKIMVTLQTNISPIFFEWSKKKKCINILHFIDIIHHAEIFRPSFSIFGKTLEAAAPKVNIPPITVIYPISRVPSFKVNPQQLVFKHGMIAFCSQLKIRNFYSNCERVNAKGDNVEQSRLESAEFSKKSVFLPLRCASPIFDPFMKVILSK